MKVDFITRVYVHNNRECRVIQNALPYESVSYLMLVSMMEEVFVLYILLIVNKIELMNEIFGCMHG